VSSFDLDDVKVDITSSDSTIDQQMHIVMDGLHISAKARPAMMALSKPQKVTMIQQFYAKQNGGSSSDSDSGSSPKKLKVGPNKMAKNISAPSLMSAPPTNTVSLSEAKRKLKAKGKGKGQIHRQHSSNSLSRIPNLKPSVALQLKESKSAPRPRPKSRHKKSRSNIKDQAYLIAEEFSKSKSHGGSPRNRPPPPGKFKGRVSLPPPPSAGKLKHRPNSAHIVQKHVADPPMSTLRVRSVDQYTSHRVGTAVHENYAEMNDSEYEYYDDDEVMAPAPPPPIPPKAKKTTNVKVKLKVGSPVEVFSNSQQCWIDGKIVKIKGKLLCIAYGPGSETQKWLEATSKDFRPKMEDIERAQHHKPAAPNHLVPESKMQHLGGDEGSVYPPRYRQSVALQQNKQIKVKLRIGSPVEVFSVSNNQWIDGKLTGIKKGLIRVAYGKTLDMEKWLRSDSKQFRPKLDMVDAAYSQHQDRRPKGPRPPKLPMASDYIIGGDEDAEGVHHDNDHQGGPLPAGGSYLTHSLRREQYVKQSVQSVKGNMKKRGDLKIKVHGALQLKHNANFVSVTVAEHCLKTKKVASDENPVWKEILTFSNYRPHIGKTAVINVVNKGIMGERVVGSAEFELPIVFRRQEKMTIDIADKNNKLSGIIVLEQCVVEIGR